MTRIHPVPSHGPRLDGLLCFAVYAANNAFGRLYKPLLDELGLSYPQYLVMAVLWERDDLLVGEIGTRLFLDSNTLTPLLKRIEAAGLVHRRRDPADERQVRITLTAAGRALEARAACLPSQIVTASARSGVELDRLREEIVALGDAIRKARAPGEEQPAI